MFIVWRGVGWLVPALYIISVFVVTFMSKSVGTELDDFSAQIMSAVVAAILIALLGYRVNVRKQFEGREETKYKLLKGRKHTLFFIPVQYWALIVLVIFGYAALDKREKNELTQEYLSLPMVGDVYVVDYSKIEGEYEEGYKYGAMKIVDIDSDFVEFAYGDYVYEKKRSVYDALEEGNEFADYDKDPDLTTYLERVDIPGYSDSGAILRVLRDTN